MADSVKRVKIQATADLKGFEDASKALKDLQRAIGPTDEALEQVRKEILDFAAANKQSEAVLQAQLNAFQKLRQQAEMGGKVYNDLGRDIDRLKQIATGSTGAINKLGQAVNNAGRSSSGKSVWQQQAQELGAFNKQAGETGKAIGQLAGAFNIKFAKAGEAIQEASRQIETLKRNASSIGTLAQGPKAGGGVFEVGRKGLADIQSLATLMRGLKEQSESAVGKVARISEGMFALGATGAAVKPAISALGGVAGAAEKVSSFAANLSGMFAQMGASTPQWSGPMKTALNQIALLLNEPANGVANWSQSLSGLQSKLGMLNAPLEAFGNAVAAIGPEGAAMAGGLALAMAVVEDQLSKSLRKTEKEASEALQGITNETQQLIVKLGLLSEAFRGAASMRELQALRAGGAARFDETPAGTQASRRAANTIASAEARIKAEGMAQAQVLEQARQRYRGTAQSADALSERLAYLQSAMKLVDQSTTEGKAEFAAFASEAGQVKKQIDALSNSYRTVADAIRDAAQAQGQYANQSTAANYFNRAAVRRQEEIAQAARDQLARPQTPLLPAAGQTSFAGEYGPGGIGGGARMGTGAKEFPNVIGAEQIGNGVTAIYRGLERTEMQAAATGAALEREFNAAGAALNRAESELNELQKELNETLKGGGRLGEVLSKIKVADPNSINMLRARREQIDQERNSVKILSEDYRRLSRELTSVDKQIERTQSGGLRGKVGYIGQGIGAMASAGVFGGIEGAVGGALGGAIGALGGPAGFAAGSFIGSSVGAYAGMGRQQLGGFADYAAQLEKQKIALKGVAGSLDEYQRAVAAAENVSLRFNVPIGETTRSMTQLSAAVIGAGGKVNDAEIVYRNITTAIKATGGGAEEVQGALTAMAQIFSKGKVSAEELQGQLGERLPGAVTAFAKATGRTLPQLQKDLEQGVVGLNDVMKFVVSLGDQYAATADKVAQSDADAGQRFQKVFADFRVAIGRELIPLGSELQGAFADFLKEITPASIAAAKGFIAIAQAIGVAVKAFVSFTEPLRQLYEVGLPAYLAGFKAFWSKIGNDFESFGNKVSSFASAISGWFASAFAAIKSAAKSALQAVGIDMDWLGGVFQNVVGFLGNAWNKFFEFVTKRWRETVRNMVNNTNPLFFLLEKAGVVDVGGAVANALTASGSSVQFSQAPPAPVLPPPSSGGGPSTFQDPAGQDGGTGDSKDRADKARDDAERLAAEQQRLDESLARNAIELDNERFRNRMDLLRKEYELTLELNNRSNDIWAKQFSGLGAQSARAVTELLGKLQGYETRIYEARQEVASARQGVMSSQALERVTSQGLGSPASVGAGLSAGSVSGSKRLDVGTLKGLAKAAGFSDRDAAVMAAIAMAESGGRSSAHNPNAATGDNSYGLWQVNMLGRMGPERRRQFGIGSNEALFDPAVNASAARKVYEGQGFGAWSVYRSGAYKQYLPGAMSADSKLPTGVAGQVRRDASAEGQVAVSKEQLTQQQALLKLEEKRADELKKFDFVEFNQQLTSSLKEQGMALEESLSNFQLKSSLEAQGMRPELVQAEMDKARLYKEQAELLEPLIEAEKIVKDPKANKAIVDSIAEINRHYGDQLYLVDALAQAQTAQGVALAAYLGQLRLQIAEMTNIENIAIRMGQTIETEISTAMSSAVSAVVTGSGSVKEALGNMFKNIGQAFIKMATDIIAKQMVMIVLQSVLKALGGGAFGGGGAVGGGPMFNPAAFSMPQLAANGATFANGMAKFAKGGVVSRPTFFKFANGGTVQNGVMGEAGPEAIVPLKRGFDGRLGIAQVPSPQGGDSRMRDMMGRSPAQQQAPTLNLKFETTKINGVEYVSKDQLEVAMAQTRRQAASDGAKRGMNMTLDKIQNSPSTRTRVGIR